MVLIETIGEIIHDPFLPGQVEWLFPNVYCHYNEDTYTQSPRIASPWFMFEGIEFRLAVFPNPCSEYISLFLWRRHKVGRNNSFSAIFHLHIDNEDPYDFSLKYGLSHESLEWELSENVGLHHVLPLRIFNDGMTRVSPNGICKFLLTLSEEVASNCSDDTNSESCSPFREKIKEELLPFIIINDINTEKIEEVEGMNRLVQNLKNMLHEGPNSDVTLKVGDRNFPAHRCMLSVRSPVFASMFHHDMAERNSEAVDIPDCSPEAFEALLLYLYTGSAATLSDSNVSDVYYAADKYQVFDLKKDCAEHMKRTLSLDTFCDVMALSLRHSEFELQEIAIRYFCNNVRKIIKTVKWQKYVQKYPLYANELHIKALDVLIDK